MRNKKIYCRATDSSIRRHSENFSKGTIYEVINEEYKTDIGISLRYSGDGDNYIKEITYQQVGGKLL